MEGKVSVNRLGTVMFVIGALLAVGLTSSGQTSGPSAATPTASTIGDSGQTIVFHMDAYAMNETLLFTTRPSEPGAEQPQFADMSFTGPQHAKILPSSHSMDAVASRGFKARPYLLGHTVGDVVWTPYIFAPFAMKPDQILSTTLGPVSPEVSLNLTRLYSDPSQNALHLYGERDVFRVGAKLLYDGVLNATVEAVDGDSATLSVTANGGEVIPARALGLPTRISKDAVGNLYLHPIAEVGETFTTQGCPLPGAILIPGAYDVTAVTESEILVKAHVKHDYLYSQPVQFRFEIVAIEP